MKWETTKCTLIQKLEAREGCKRLRIKIGRQGRRGRPSVSCPFWAVSGSAKPFVFLSRDLRSKANVMALSSKQPCGESKDQLPYVKAR